MDGFIHDLSVLGDVRHEHVLLSHAALHLGLTTHEDVHREICINRHADFGANAAIGTFRLWHYHQHIHIRVLVRLAVSVGAEEDDLQRLEGGGDGVTVALDVRFGYHAEDLAFLAGLLQGDFAAALCLVDALPSPPSCAVRLHELPQVLRVLQIGINNHSLKP